MPEEPQIKSLSKTRRHFLFFTLVAVFLVALPTMIFYTTGYRLNFDNEDSVVVTTGGIYVTTDNLDVDVFLDGEQVDRPRLFRSAYYIQNIETGMHRVVVQSPELQTWVKELPIDPRIVVEVASFNVPLIPHIRPISEYSTQDDTSVYLGVASSTDLFPKATSTEPYLATSSESVIDYELNEEFVFVSSLFSTTSTSSRSVFDRFLDEVDRFRFATTSEEVDKVSTSTEDFVENGNMRLVERKNEIIAVWTGEADKTPHYFCVPKASTSTIEARYGEHVAEAIDEMSKSTTTSLMVDGYRLCRPEIKLNRLQQDVYFYDFFPNSSNLALLQLEDGLYVSELDDRAWQNTQLLYPGQDFRVVVENDVIYLEEDDKYFELFTEIESN